MATTDMGWKIGGELWPFEGRETGSPCNTMWPGLRPTSVPSFTLIHPTIWPQYTNVTDRGQTDTTDRQTDRQQSDSTGQTVLQTFAQKIHATVQQRVAPWPLITYCCQVAPLLRTTFHTANFLIKGTHPHATSAMRHYMQFCYTM